MVLRHAMKHFYKPQPGLLPELGQSRAPATRPPVPVYRVGEPFRHGRKTWPETAQFIAGPCGHELTLFRSHINDDLIREIRRGQSEFAVVVELSVIVLAYRLDYSNSWSDIPYCWHLQPEQWRVLPSVDQSPEARALLWITLVGADDGIIHAQRGVTLSPGFTRVFHTAIRNQATGVFQPEECTAALFRIFFRYPNAIDRLALAAARTQGNE
jgi:hypothetical protein